MERTVKLRSFDGTVMEGTYCNGKGGRDSVAILVHGITSNRDELGLFSGLAAHLSEDGMPSLRFEYRCHGISQVQMETMTLLGIANDIEAGARAAISEAGASRVHIVGMSFGGGVSAYWAATTKLSVRSVTMLAPVLDYEEDVLGQHGALVGERLRDDLGMQLHRQGYVEMDGIRYGAAMLNELRFVSGDDGLRRMNCPALIVHGDADSIVPYSSSERVAGRHKGCDLVNIPGTDHGFGVGEDEELTSPATKDRHRQVWGIVSRFMHREDLK